jgi:hypothetical protein
MLVALAVLVGMALLGFAQPKWDENPHQLSAESAFAEALGCVLVVASILPTFALFMLFHRLQLNGVLRDGLVRAGSQTVQRHDLIQSDLQHWLPPGDPTPADPVYLDGIVYPDAWVLTCHPDLGTRETQSMLGDLSLSIHTPVPAKNCTPSTPIPPRDEGSAGYANSFEYRLWEAVAEAPEQHRRLEFLRGGAPDHPAPAGRPKAPDAQDDLDVRGDAIQCYSAVSTHDVGAQGADKQAAKSRGLSYEICKLSLTDGNEISVMAPSARFGYLLHLQPKDQDRGLALLGLLASFTAVWLALSIVTRLLSRRLFGLATSYAAPEKTVASVESQAPCPNEDTFKRKWRALSHPEQLLLYQLARGQIPNSHSDAAVKKLLEKGLVKLDPWPKLSWDESEARLVLGAEKPDDFQAWEKAAAKGAWQTIRPVLFIVLMVLIAWLSWAAGGSMKALSAILLATGAFLAQLSQLVNFVRGGFGGTPKS